MGLPKAKADEAAQKRAEEAERVTKTSSAKERYLARKKAAAEGQAEG